jgi:hypothetical protein
MRIGGIDLYETHVVSSMFWRQHETRPWTSFAYESAPLELGAVRSSIAFNEGKVGPTRSDCDISSLRSSVENLVNEIILVLKISNLNKELWRSHGCPRG